jgi:hypothetical protein
MPYDEQGNFYGSNEDLGDLEAKYTKPARPDPVSQIPGQVSTSKPEESKSLREKAVSALMQYNPLMMQKSLQDMSRTLVGGAALPVVAPVSAGVQALNALPGNLLRRSRGEEEVKTPTAEDLMRKYGEAIAPKTELGQNFQEGVGKLMDTLKVPAAWPVAPNVPRRPMLTPTDVRVGAGQIKQLAKELKETPRDFQAAQSGLKRQNLYGEETIGVKAQAAADSLGDTLERRRASGRSAIPGVPGVLTPETSMYAVRPKGSRLVQPKVPESAKNYTPEFSQLPDYVEEVYGNLGAGEIPPTVIMGEYAPRFLSSEATRDFRKGILALDTQKALETFPDAPDEGSAIRAYELLYSDREARAAKSLETIEEFLAMPENQRFVEAGIPTPSQFLDRFKEAGRVVKGPLVNYISKNVGTEADPTVKLARQGITYESPERIQELAQYVRPDVLGMVRTKGGFPAMGSFHEERLAKTGELDRLNEEIAALEEVRTPLFNRAHEEGIDPASIPEYAETTNPLRQKMRQREQLQGELENIKLATSMENLSDSSITPKSRAQMLGDIPYQERQFFPSVTKGSESDTFYTLSNSRLLQDIGYKKLGKELVEDILTGKAGDTSKLTIENYIRDKGLSRAEAEKAAKLQQDQYRQSVQNVLLQRIRNDPSVKTFGNAAIITLDKDTPKEVALRDMSSDTAVLDHCVGQGCSAAEGKRNPFTNEKQIYEPIVDPVTGQPNKNSQAEAYSAYVEGLVAGNELVSVRDVKTGLPAATLQFQTTGDVGKFRIGYASGARNRAIKPEYIDALKQYLNSRADSITSSGENLSDNAGIFDLGNAQGRDQALRAAGIKGYAPGGKAAQIQRALELAIENSPDMPRFVTSDDVKKIFEGTSREVAVVDQPSATRPTGAMELRDYDGFVEEFNNALEAAAESAMENSNLENPSRIEGAIGRAVTTIFDNHLNDPVMFIQDPVAHLRRAERDLQNIIENSYAQRREIDTELANGLEDFLLDVRGLRASFERRIDAAQQQDPLANLRQGEGAVVRLEAEGPRAGPPIPNLDVTDLINTYGDRMTPEQLNWLQNFTQRWDNEVDGSPAGQGIEDVMIAEYGRWRAENRLQPIEGEAPYLGDWEVDETHPANVQDMPQVANELYYMDVNDQGVPDIPAIEDTIFALRNGTIDHRDFRRLPEAERPEAMRVVAALIENRLDNIRRGRVQPEQLAQGRREMQQAREQLLTQPEQPAPVEDRFTLALRYNIPPVTVQEIQARFRDPEITVADLGMLRESARTGAPRTVFENLPQESRDGAANMIAEEIQRRREQAPAQPVPARARRVTFNEFNGDLTFREAEQRIQQIANDPAYTVRQLRRLSGLIENPDHPQFRVLDQDQIDGLNAIIDGGLQQRRQGRQAPAQPEQQAPRIQVQDPVPREMQTLNRQDLVLRLGPEGVGEAQRIAQQYFNDNLFNDDTPVSAATNVIRSYNFGPHEGQPPMVRELAARELEQLVTNADQDADILANALDEAMYQDMAGPEEAMRAANRDISILRQYGENVWEDVFGPLAEDYPWSRNTQERAIQNLQLIADEYRSLRDEEEYMNRRNNDEGEGGQPADNQPRRGPFQPGGASAVRGVPLGNLNIQPAIRAEALRGPDSQPVRNFLQQVRGLPGVTQEGLTTGLMAFENMDPNRRMTKAEFVRELLPSSYDIVDLRGTADDNVHYRDMAEQHVSEDPESVLNEIGISDRYHGEILDVINDDLAFEELSSGAKKALKKKNIEDYDSLYSSHAEAFRALVENGMEYLADMDGTQVADANGFRYANTQRLVLNSTGDEYSEFGVTHPDEQRTYHHFANAPDGLIGHVRGTYNPDGLEVKTADADIFTTKSNSYVIEEIQSDAQKNSQQVAHLHQVHGVLFKAAIQKALESGADVVYLPTAKVIASERPGAGGHEPRRDERTGLTTMVPIKKDTTNKFKPIYDQAIIKEGLKPLLKIRGVTSKLVSGGDYHEITFTPEAKEYILNGPGQTVPGYAKGGLVKKPMMPPVITRRHPELAEMQYRYGGMV